MALHLRPRYRVLTNPTQFRFHSLSSSSNPSDRSHQSPENTTNAWRLAPPDSTSSSQPISLQELYNNRNVTKTSLAGIRESFNKIRAGTQQAERGGEEAKFLRNSLRLRPAQSNADSRFIGALPRMGFVKRYDCEDLGKKLKALSAGKGGFSVCELNDRLVKLREMEEQEAESKHKLPIIDLRESLFNIGMSDMQKSRTPAKLNALGGLGLTPGYTLQPPQEHLVEKYFHPENMSAAEKLKLELQKVREDFKMSESDCGSARVQVAQLTTKIKHLSSVLHKKDKHSRKGLVAMVQRRKKLLKYLRGTDWDSYCFVLSNLGLRDNPDYKN